MKRFLALILALCMCLLPTTAFAMESVEEESIDYMNYNFPEDAIVLYQGEDGVVYQTHEEVSDVTLASPRSTEYASVWIDANQHKTGNFSVKNPHTIINRTEGTLKVECQDSTASAQMVVYAGVSVLANKIVKASDGDVRFSFQSHASTVTITYYTQHVSTRYGMRLMCWLW